MSPISGGLVRLLSASPEKPAAGQPPADEDQGEVAHAYLEAGEEQGLIEGDERRLLQSIVDFGGTLVREVMTPRPDIVAIREDARMRDLLNLFREQEYSRFPVFRENLDNIVGVVFVKGLIPLGDQATPTDAPIERLLRPGTFIPETKRVPELLKEFQRKRVQIAIVVDEYGGTAGLVRIDELVGGTCGVC